MTGFTIEVTKTSEPFNQAYTLGTFPSITIKMTKSASRALMELVPPMPYISPSFERYCEQRTYRHNGRRFALQNNRMVIR